jgi:hypothetical protein
VPGITASPARKRGHLVIARGMSDALVRTEPPRCVVVLIAGGRGSCAAAAVPPWSAADLWALPIITTVCTTSKTARVALRCGGVT